MPEIPLEFTNKLRQLLHSEGVDRFGKDILVREIKELIHAYVLLPEPEVEVAKAKRGRPRKKVA